MMVPAARSFRLGSNMCKPVSSEAQVEWCSVHTKSAAKLCLKTFGHGPLQVTNIDSRPFMLMDPQQLRELALYSLVSDVDLVISGPNVGHNMGRASVLSSGTLGVAMEASLAHKKAIAMSFPLNGWGSWTEEDIWTAVQVSRACVDTGRVFDVLL
ncbi:hypothetical protein ABBQ38_012600 [Trebouxia sp. C0009 RCD-2024]